MSRSAISDSSERIHDSDTLRNAEQPAENAERRVEITGSKPQIPDNLRLLSVARSRLHLIRDRVNSPATPHLAAAIRVYVSVPRVR